MTAFTDGIRATDLLRWRGWDGAVADLWQAEGVADGCGHYLSPDPRVVIFLDDGASPIRLSDRPGRIGVAPVGICFIPAHMPLWSRVVEPGMFRHLDLHFDGASLAQKLGERIGAARAQAALDRPVMLERHGAIEPLARLLAEEVALPAQPDLFAESLALAILACLLIPPGAEHAEPQRGGLTPMQMRKLTGLMQANLHRRLSVTDMARHVGLSESWFARAFKQSLGETPHSWQIGQRIAAAKTLLETRNAALADVAAATGFADQAHLTRAFRLVTGTTPAAWRRARAA